MKKIGILIIGILLLFAGCIQNDVTKPSSTASQETAYDNINVFETLETPAKSPDDCMVATPEDVTDSSQTFEDLSDNAKAYCLVLDELMQLDEALNHDMSYIAIDVETLSDLTDEEKQSLLSYYSDTYAIEVMASSIQELYDNGFGDEENHYLYGIALKIDEITNISDTIVRYDCSKYRSGIGAIGVFVEVEKSDNVWTVKDTGMVWIS